MAHEIESIAYANAVPWHGLGTQVSDDLNDEQFLKAAGLDWKVELKPLKADLGGGEYADVPGRFALVRNTDRKILTIAGQTWRPFQNADALKFIGDYAKAGGATLETAGSLQGGTMVWGLAALKHSFAVRPGDTIRGYLLLTVPHTVGTAHTIRTTAVRVVCANTLALASRSDANINYRQNHLSDFDVSAAKDAVGKAHVELAEAERRFKIIADLKLSIEDAVKKVLIPVFEPELLGTPAFENILSPENLPKKIDAILASAANAPGNEAGTGWGLLNGVTHWADHVAGTNSGRRLFRAWLGDTAAHKQAVEQKLLELAA